MLALQLKKLHMDNNKILSVSRLKKHFSLKGPGLLSPTATVYAVDDISIDLFKRETLGLVGESGCGKTTVGRCILRLIDPTSGDIFFNGKNITQLHSAQLKKLRREMQIVFQDPYGCLTPRLKISSLLQEPLNIHGLGKTKSQRKDMVNEMLEKVGLHSKSMNKYAHEFSGGQRQRLSIARALIVQPKLIIADEPVSALDMSIQAEILNLLVDLQRQFQLSYLMISHDLSVVKYMCDRIAVMYLGKIVEMADKEKLFSNHQHPYTEALLSAIPVPAATKRRKRIILRGDVPSPIDPPSGCRFHPRCIYKKAICSRIEPELKALGTGHFVACHLR